MRASFCRTGLRSKMLGLHNCNTRSDLRHAFRLQLFRSNEYLFAI
jgi:hypothetical protein